MRAGIRMVIKRQPDKLTYKIVYNVFKLSQFYAPRDEELDISQRLKNMSFTELSFNQGFEMGCCSKEGVKW